MVRSFMTRVLVLGFIALGSLVACGGGAGGPLRSPSLDYEPPAPTTADGDTVGADQTGPGDKLHQGATSAAPAPGWSVNQDGATYDPKQHVGGAIDPVPANGSSGSK
jgi:hypothetical protein